MLRHFVRVRGFSSTEDEIRVFAFAEIYLGFHFHLDVVVLLSAICIWGWSLALWLIKLCLRDEYGSLYRIFELSTVFR